MEMALSRLCSNVTLPKRLGSRVRVWVKISQLRRTDVGWPGDDFDRGRVVAGRGCWEWLVKDQSHVHQVLDMVRPYVRVKARQVELALQILKFRVDSMDELQQVAELADALCF
jgi:hypothetical protein